MVSTGRITAFVGSVYF